MLRLLLERRSIGQELRILLFRGERVEEVLVDHSAGQEGVPLRFALRRDARAPLHALPVERTNERVGESARVERAREWERARERESAREEALEEEEGGTVSTPTRRSDTRVGSTNAYAF